MRVGVSVGVGIGYRYHLGAGGRCNPSINCSVLHNYYYAWRSVVLAGRVGRLGPIRSYCQMDRGVKVAYDNHGKQNFRPSAVG